MYYYLLITVCDLNCFRYFSRDLRYTRTRFMFWFFSSKYCIWLELHRTPQKAQMIIFLSFFSFFFFALALCNGFRPHSFIWNEFWIWMYVRSEQLAWGMNKQHAYNISRRMYDQSRSVELNIVFYSKHFLIEYTCELTWVYTLPSVWCIHHFNECFEIFFFSFDIRWICEGQRKRQR